MKKCVVIMKLNRVLFFNKERLRIKKEFRSEKYNSWNEKLIEGLEDKVE